MMNMFHEGKLKEALYGGKEGFTPEEIKFANKHAPKDMHYVETSQERVEGPPGFKYDETYWYLQLEPRCLLSLPRIPALLARALTKPGSGLRRPASKWRPERHLTAHCSANPSPSAAKMTIPDRRSSCLKVSTSCCPGTGPNQKTGNPPQQPEASKGNSPEGYASRTLFDNSPSGARTGSVELVDGEANAMYLARIGFFHAI